MAMSDNRPGLTGSPVYEEDRRMSALPAFMLFAILCTVLVICIA
jgi:hypothetical protein